MKRASRTIQSAYLDTKGTLVAYYDELRNGHRVGESVDIHYGYAKLWIAPVEDSHAARGTPGRIIFPRYSNTAVLRLAKGGRFQARMASAANGSENTRRLGLAVQYVHLYLAHGEELSWHDIPGQMSATFTIQQGAEYEIAPNYRAGQHLPGYNDPLINKVTGTHPDADKTEEAA